VCSYGVGQNSKMHRCLTTSEAHIVLKELHEGVARGHFAANIIAKFFYGCRVLVANSILGYS
jgi:hypothetical protein